MTARRFLTALDKGDTLDPTHRLTVDLTETGIGFVPAGTLVEYAGDPHYHLQPIDAASNAEWLTTTADSTRSDIYRGRSMPGSNPA